MFDYEAIKELARVPGLRASDLIVLSPGNDPFYAGVPARRERAEWFADIWQSFGYSGAHIRRIHYIMISQPEPIRWPNGTSSWISTTRVMHAIWVEVGAGAFAQSAAQIGGQTALSSSRAAVRTARLICFDALELSRLRCVSMPFVAWRRAHYQCEPVMPFQAGLSHHGESTDRRPCGLP